MGTKIVYNHKAIEKKWRERWEENPVNPRLDDNGNKKQKYYCLDMFPYPSGNGLHVGHWRGYVISDVWSRYKLQQGYYIVHPMGWDAFGLPAENYAIKMGVHPAKSTAENVANIKKQINDIAALYDWDMEVNTTDPNFYKWTQWIFVKMFKAGLAYEKEFPINWCPSCKTGLANEEVVNGKCERCGAEVTKKNLRLLKVDMSKDDKVRKQFVSVNGGLLVQDQDTATKTVVPEMCVTEPKPLQEDMEDLNFAWHIVKHVKSNAIVVVKNGMTYGVGAGQMNRIGSAEIALKEAKTTIEANGGKVEDFGLILASDGFFPFDDCVALAAEYGVKAIVQPGGSVRDEDSIRKANEHGIPMLFTGNRHFKH